MGPLFFNLKSAATIITASAAVFFMLILGNTTHAASLDIMISEIQTGGAGSGTASQEFVEIINTSDGDIELNGWKLLYSSATDGTQNTLLELAGGIRANQSLLIVSASYPLPVDVLADATFAYNGGLSSAGGHVKIVNNLGQEIDRVGWGSAQFSESMSAPAPSGGQSITRNASPAVQDTDHNFNDFATQAVPSPVGGGWFEIIPSNPTYLPVVITELLPNPASPKTDAADEFIEIFNPNDETVNLVGYKLQTGSSYQYEFTLPEITILPDGHVVFYSEETNLALTNSGGNARILDPLEVVRDSVTYPAVTEAKVWALIDSEWQQSDQATPGLPNVLLVSSPEPSGGGGSGGLKPCRADQFRNPLTNRCKLKETSSSSLKACLPGQYRNPETNRCRNIATTASALTPCNAGQYRNPATNRCKKIANASSLVPCRDGYQRNVETNRCRKVAGVSTANALSSPAAAPAQAKQNYTLVMIVAALAVCYGLYEYRQDIKNIGARILKRRGS